MGPSAKVMVNGDRSQIDLPTKQKSGLMLALDILKDVKGIGFVEMNVEDVVRHRLVKDIVQAYDKFDVQQQHDQTNRPIRDYQPRTQPRFVRRNRRPRPPPRRPPRKRRNAGFARQPRATLEMLNFEG